ncbi:MAG: hypothetical protein ACE5FB_07760 [Candidatus Binatia bacterium]
MDVLDFSEGPHAKAIDVSQWYGVNTDWTVESLRHPWLIHNGSC